MATLPEIPVRSHHPACLSIRPSVAPLAPLGTSGSGSQPSWAAPASRAVCLAAPLTPRSAVGQDEILYMGFDGTKIGLPKDFVLTDYSKVRARSPELAPRESTCVWTQSAG